jgi:hypothetical protein
MRQATERGEVGPDGKATVPPRGGPQGKETARSLPKGDDKEGNASKPKERTAERFEDEGAQFEFNPDQPRAPGGKHGGRWIDAPGGGTVFKPKIGGRVAFGRARWVAATTKAGTVTDMKPVEQEMTGTVRSRSPSGRAMVEVRGQFYIVEPADLRPGARQKRAKVAPDGSVDTRLRGGEITDDLAQKPSDFSEESRDSLRRYTSSTADSDAYRRINRNLRRSKGESSNSDVAGLDAAFDAAKPLSAEAVTYRAVRYAGATKVRIAEGETVTDHGFVSTTPARARAVKFGEDNWDLIELTLPVGTKALDVNRVIPAHFGKERELLLRRSTRFRVTSVEPRPDGSGRLVKGTVIA